MLQPVIRRSRAYKLRKLLRTDGIRETSLDLVLMMLTRHGTSFDPRVRLDGAELLSAERPTLIVCTHTMLAALITRCMHDRGIRLTGIVAEPMKVPGTKIDARVIVPSRTMFVTTRELFAAGETVAAMIDRGEVEARQRIMPTARGEFLISTPLLELALRQRVRIVFLAGTVVGDWEVTLTLTEPPQYESTTVDDVLEHFAAFVDRHVHAKT